MLKTIAWMSLIMACTANDSSVIDFKQKVEVIERTASASKVSLHWKGNSNKAFGSFPTLFAANEKLAYACNAGMYDGTIDRKPVCQTSW